VSDSARSVFSAVDQDKVLSAFDAVTDDGLDSTFFTDSPAAAGQESSASGAWTSDPERRRAFILHGPGMFT